MASGAKTSESTRRARRALWVAGVVLLVIGLMAAAGYSFFTGWRARDLAAKAKENFERGNYCRAWLQISSAKDLRGEDP